MKPNLKVLLLLLSVTAALVAYALLGPDLDSELLLSDKTR